MSLVFAFCGCRSSDGHTGLPTPPPTPSDLFIPDAPIQFDIISPNDEPSHATQSKEGPPKYVHVCKPLFV